MLARNTERQLIGLSSGCRPGISNSGPGTAISSTRHSLQRVRQATGPVVPVCLNVKRAHRNRRLLVRPDSLLQPVGQWYTTRTDPNEDKGTRSVITFKYLVRDTRERAGYIGTIQQESIAHTFPLAGGMPGGHLKRL